MHELDLTATRMTQMSFPWPGPADTDRPLLTESGEDLLIRISHALVCVAPACIVLSTWNE